MRKFQTKFIFFITTIMVVVSVIPFVPQEILKPIEDAVKIKEAKAVDWAPAFGVTVRDVGCSQQERSSSMLSFTGTVAATDANGKDIDCARIYLGGSYSTPSNPYDSLFMNDFRIGIQVAESEGGCTSHMGAIGWTGWATDGGGSGSTNGSGGMQAADCVRVHMELRPMPNRQAIRDFSIGLQVGGGAMVFTPSGAFSQTGDFTSASIALNATTITVPDDAQFVSTTVPTIPASMTLNQQSANSNIVMQNKGGTWNTDATYSGGGACASWTPSGPGQTCVENRVMTSDQYVLRRTDNNSARASTTLNEFKYKENVTYSYYSVEETYPDCVWVPDEGGGGLEEPPVSYEEPAKSWLFKEAKAIPVPGEGGHWECTDVPTGNYLAGGPNISNNPNIAYNQNATFDDVLITPLQPGNTTLTFRMYNNADGSYFGESKDLVINSDAPLNPRFTCGSDLSKTASNAPGSTAQYAVWATPIDGFSSNIAVTAPGAPATYNPVTLIPSGYSSTLTFNTSGVAPNTYNFDLVFTKQGGGHTENCPIQLIITAAPTPVPTIVLDLKCRGENGILSDGPCNVAYNSGGSVEWTSQHTVSCNVNGAGIGVNNGPVNGSANTSSLTSNAIVNLNCYNSDSDNDEDNVQFIVGAAPTPTPPSADIKCRQQNGIYSDGPCTIPYNTVATVQWSSQYATSCSVTGAGINASGTSGNTTSSALTNAATVFLSCSGPGGSDNDSVDILVEAAPLPDPIVDLQCQLPNGTFGNGPCTVPYNTQGTVQWTTQFATSCYWDNGLSGTTGTSGTTNTPNLTSTFVVGIACMNADGVEANDSVTFNVGLPDPTVNLECQNSNGTYSDGPCTISYNNPGTVRWTSQNANSCYWDNGFSGAAATNGTRNTPNLTANFTAGIACTNADGVEANDSVTFVISGGPPWVDLKCQGSAPGYSDGPCTVAYDTTGYLEWSSANIQDGCDLSGGINDNVAENGTNYPTGNLTANMSVTLTCYQGGLSASDTVQFQVEAQLVADIQCATTGSNAFSNGPCTIEYDTAPRLMWSSNLNMCRYLRPNGWTGNQPSDQGPFDAQNLFSDHTYVLRCYSNPSGIGFYVEDAVDIIVNPELPPNMTADIQCATSLNGAYGPGPCTILAGTAGGLQWTSNATAGCDLQTPYGWNINQPSNYGPTNSDTLFADHTYVIRCYNDAGHTGLFAQASVSFVVTPLPGVDITCDGLDDCSTVAGSTVDVAWSSSNTSSCETTSNRPGFGIQLGTSGSRVSQPINTDPTTFTSDCLGAGGSATDTATVTLVATPTPTPTPFVDIICDGSDDCSTTSGSTVGLWWSATNATSCTIVSDQGGFVPQNGTSGTATSQPIIVDPTRFTANCIGLDGVMTATDTALVSIVTVLDPRFTMNCSPATRTVQRGQSVTYIIDTTSIDGFNSNVSFNYNYVNSSPPIPPTIDISPSSHTPSGTSIVTVTTDASTSTGSYTIQFNGSSGALTETCQVDLDITASTPPGPPQVYHDPSPCGTVVIRWEAGSAPDPDYFILYHSLDPSGPWSPAQQINQQNFSPFSQYYYYTHLNPNMMQANYYAVIAYRSGSESVPGTLPNIIPLSCSPDLSNSDKQLDNVNGVQGIIAQPGDEIPTACDGDAERYVSNTNLYTPGQTVEFTLCVSNAGGQTDLRGATVTDTPNNITINSVSFSLVNGVTCGFANTNTFYSLIDIPAGLQCIITVTGTITSPASAEPIEKFGNEAYIVGYGDPSDPTAYTKTVNSGLYNFSATEQFPDRKEIAP